MSCYELSIERVTGAGIGASAGKVTVYDANEQRIHLTEESENFQWDPPSRIEGRLDDNMELIFLVSLRRRLPGPSTKRSPLLTVQEMWRNAKNDVDKKKTIGDRSDDRKRHYLHDLNGISLQILLREITAEEQGDEAFQRKDYREAINHFSTAIDQSEIFTPVPSGRASTADTGSAELYYKRALAYEKIGEWDSAVQDAEKCHEQGDNPRFRRILPFMHMRRGEVALEDKEYRSAIADFRAGIDKLQLGNPRNSIAIVANPSMPNSYEIQRRLEEGLKDAQAAHADDIQRLPRVLDAIFDPEKLHIRQALIKDPETRVFITKPSFMAMLKRLKTDPKEFESADFRENGVEKVIRVVEHELFSSEGTGSIDALFGV